MGLSKRQRTGLLVASFLIAPATVRSTAEGAARRPTVGAGIRQALATSARVRVMVTFETPAPGELRTPEGRARQRAAVQDRAEAVLSSLGPEFVVRRRFETVNALAGDLSVEGLRLLEQNPEIIGVDLDAGGQGHLDQARPLAGIDAVQGLGYTGQGITVAVLDSGVDTDHPDLMADLAGQQCFCSPSCCPDGTATQSGPGAAEDDNGHGTNVTGIVTSTGTVAPRGAAPNADIVAVKVLDRFNSFCCSSDVIAGLDWVLNNRPDVDVVNMSLGTSALFTGACDTATTFTQAYATAVNNLKAAGKVVFASSGNQASATSMAAPACVANTIAVGAVYDNNIGSSTFGCTDVTTAPDKPTCFSNSNSTTDLFAPGALTTSTGVGGVTSTYRGTSQASPLAAGCVALLKEVHPGATPDELEQAIEASPTQVVDPKNGLSFPRLDCAAAEALLRTLTARAFHTLTPCRLIDTRQPANGPALAANSTRTFPITGRCGVPSSARAIAFNVTAVQAGSPGNLRLYPAGDDPPLASSLNYSTGATRGNNGVVGLAAGMLAVRCNQASGTVHMVLDVTGYFE